MHALLPPMNVILETRVNMGVLVCHYEAPTGENTQPADELRPKFQEEG